MAKHIALIALAAFSLSACDKPADVASRNLSTAADNFEVNRRIVFYNVRRGEYMLSIEGLCSLGNADKGGELTVTCKTGPEAYKKHFLGLATEVTFFAEQIEPAPASTYRYRVIFNPATIIPDIQAH